MSALDEASIQAALKQLRDGNATAALYNAGIGRQRADWLIGMNLTMAATCLYSQGQGVLSVGRVQTPTLRLIVERDNIIKNFTPINYYELLVQFSPNEATRFWAKWQPSTDVVDEHQHCLSKTTIDAVVQKIIGEQGIVFDFTEQQKNQSPPLGFSLSGLQKIASQRFGFSAKETLNIAQALYETHKATTYPRTDCGYLPTSQLSDASEIINNLKRIYVDCLPWLNKCDTNYHSSIWNDKKITAHHAIIPTRNSAVSIHAMSEAERKIYELICHYYIAQFLGDYQYGLRTAEINISDEKFKATAHTPLIVGWKSLLKAFDETIADEESHTTLPHLIISDAVKISDHKELTKQTAPPAPYTEGTLIDAMKSIGRMLTDPNYKKILKETAGIGTEATRVNIIEMLLKREYVVKKGKQVIATEKGQQLIALLPKELSDPLITAQWEQALDAVAKNEMTLANFMEEQVKILRKLLQALDNIGGHTLSTMKDQCPHCQKSLLKRFSPKNINYFWGCSGYPSCRTAFRDMNSKPCLDQDKSHHKIQEEST